MEVGRLKLITTYLTENDCESTIVLHLTVESPKIVYTGLADKSINNGIYLNQFGEEPLQYVITNDYLLVYPCILFVYKLNNGRYQILINKQEIKLVKLISINYILLKKKM